MTRLYNKRFGSNQLSLSINSAEQQGQPLSVFPVSIDHFKNYNDSQGPLAGDEVLRQIGRIVLLAPPDQNKWHLAGISHPAQRLHANPQFSRGLAGQKKCHASGPIAAVGTFSHDSPLANRQAVPSG